MNTNKHNFARSVGVLGTVGVSALVMAFYGCSNSNSNSGGSNDAGNDTSTSNGDANSTFPEDGMSTTPESGTESDANTAADADAGGGGDGGDAGVMGTPQKVAQANLFADKDSGAPNVDPNLVNAWGLTFNPSGIAWVSANGPGLLTLYKANSPTPLSLTVKVPVAAAYRSFSTISPSPSGQIFNSLADGGGPFLNDLFIASTELGSIVGFQPSFIMDAGSTAMSRVDNTADASAATVASYKGLAIVPSSPPILLAANFNQHRLDAFDSSYALMAPAAGKWTDPSVPAGYAPFNVVTLGSNVYVAYAVVKTADAGAPTDLSGGPVDDVSGPGNGAVSVFDFSGNLVKSLVASGSSALNSPWALALVPSAGWGSLPAGTLLVGNFGDGTVHAFDSTTGALVGQLTDSAGAPLVIDGLWSLVWGPNAPDAGATPQQLFFTAGPNDESDGLFGYLTAQ